MMNRNEQFYENISFWARNEPKAAVLLPYVNCQHLVFTPAANSELNLYDENLGFYHSKENPSAESREWFQQIYSDDLEILYVFGVGLGYAYQAAIEWLRSQSGRHLVFLEDDLAVIYRLFQTDLGTALLKDPQVRLMYIDDLESKTSPVTEIYWQFMNIKMKVSALPLYASKKAHLLQLLDHKLHYDATVRHAVLDEYLTYGIGFFRNYYFNLLRLTGASSGDALEGAFQGVPIIICGAGPSLVKHAAILDQLKDRALIIAGGSAVNALNNAGVQPHLGAGIDPNSEQCKRLSSNTAFEVPYLYRNRMHYEAFRMIHGPRLFVTGSGGFDIAQWFEEQFDIQSKDIEEGFNVVNFCVDVARLWGCNPIIFVGMDLAFTDLQAYAMGVVEKASIDIDAFLSNPDLDERPLLKPDINGNPTYTLWKWITESKWISDFAEEHPELKIINATEGGIGFEGIPNMSLSEAAKLFLSETYDLDSRLHGEIQEHALTQVTLKRIIQSMQDLKDSLARCIEYLTTMIDETTFLLERIHIEEALPAILQSGKAALAENELADEPGYRYVLEIFNIVYTKKLSYEVKQLSFSSMPEWQQASARWEINNKRLVFLRDVAKANITLIDYALT